MKKRPIGRFFLYPAINIIMASRVYKGPEDPETPIALPTHTSQQETPIALPTHTSKQGIYALPMTQSVNPETPIALPTHTSQQETPIALPMTQNVNPETPIALPSQSVNPETPIALPSQSVEPTPTGPYNHPVDPQGRIEYRDPYSAATGFEYPIAENAPGDQTFVQPEAVPMVGPAGSREAVRTPPVRRLTPVEILRVPDSEIREYEAGSAQRSDIGHVDPHTGLAYTDGGVESLSVSEIDRRLAIIDRRLAEANAIHSVGQTMSNDAQAAYQLELDETAQVRRQLETVGGEFGEAYATHANALDRQSQAQDDLAQAQDRLRYAKSMGFTTLGFIYNKMKGVDIDKLQHDVARQSILLRKANSDAATADVLIEKHSLEYEQLSLDLDREQREDEEKLYELQMSQQSVDTYQRESELLQQDRAILEDEKQRRLEEIQEIEQSLADKLKELNTLVSNVDPNNYEPASPGHIRRFMGWLGRGADHLVPGTRFDPFEATLGGAGSLVDYAVDFTATTGNLLLPGDPLTTLTTYGARGITPAKYAKGLVGAVLTAPVGAFSTLFNTSVANLGVDIAAGGATVISKSAMGALDRAFANFARSTRGLEMIKTANFELSLLPRDLKQGMELLISINRLKAQRDAARDIPDPNEPPDFDPDPGTGGPTPPPPQPPSTCFLAGTKITMADGTEKNIEDVIVGDTVKAFDSDTNRVIDSPVSTVFVHPGTNGYYIINDDLMVTGNHPMWVDGEWKEVKDIVIGDKLTNLEGIEVDIETIEQVDDIITTYNFEVQNVHNYYANKFLAHNKTPPPPIDPGGGGGINFDPGDSGVPGTGGTIDWGRYGSGLHPGEYV